MTELFESFVVRLLDLLDTFPDFTYVVEQVWHLANLKEHRASLWNRLHDHISMGRVEVVGGMVTTADVNGPCGESTVRNMLLGLRWVAAEVGIEVKTGWLIDTFGVHPQMPGIFRQFGITDVMANRFGGNIPYTFFRAVGLDGSYVTILGRDVYAPATQQDPITFEFVRDWEHLETLFATSLAAWQDDRTAMPVHLLMPYTENEVLPTNRMVALTGRAADAGKGEVSFGTPSGFFAASRSVVEGLPVLSADLNPEFTGTFGQRIAIRLENRRAESLLLDAERYSVVYRRPDLVPSIAAVWWRLAAVHFHDVYTGSHPSSVFQETMAEIDFARRMATDIMAPELEHANCVFNSLPFDRLDVLRVRMNSAVPELLTEVNGDALPFIDVDDERWYRVAVGAGTVSQFVKSNGITPPTPSSSSVGSGFTLENEHLRLLVSEQGGITVTAKKSGTILISDFRDLITIQRDDGSFQIEELSRDEIGISMWDVDVVPIKMAGDFQAIALSGVVPALPWHNAQNPLRWRIIFSLLAGVPRLDMRCSIDWRGERSRIRLKLATTLSRCAAVYEVPFGVVERPPYRERGTAKGSWPAQRFVAVESNEAGVSLINTGAHGVEVLGGTIWTTLLRSPVAEYAGMAPDDTSSQHGTHQYDFAIVPFEGSLGDSATLREAQAVNHPLRLIGPGGPPAAADGGAAAPKGNTYSLVASGSIVLSALKYCEDGSGEAIVRLYEGAGHNGNARFCLDGVKEAWESDLAESKGGSILVSDGSFDVTFRAFEIKTVRVRL